MQEVRETVKAVAGEEPSEAERAAQMRKVRREIVDLHGEMVLLLNYSAVNYTGLFPNLPSGWTMTIWRLFSSNIFGHASPKKKFGRFLKL